MRTLCILTIYNEIKFLPYKLQYCIDNNLDLYVIDNMSNDGSWEWLQENNIKSHRFDTDGMFYLKALQKEMVKTVHKEKPDWAIYNGTAWQEIDNQKLFSEQTKLINTINKKLDESVFSNFVPNYKTLASIYQVFSPNTKIKNKVLLEKSIVRYMASNNIKLCERENEVKASTVKIFTSKFK